MSKQIKKRLEYLRGELRAERISYAELHELQSLVDEIPVTDVELREAAGAPEFQSDVEELVRVLKGAAYYIRYHFGDNPRHVNFSRTLDSFAKKHSKSS